MLVITLALLAFGMWMFGRNAEQPGSTDDALLSRHGERRAPSPVLTGRSAPMRERTDAATNAPERAPRRIVVNVVDPRGAPAPRAVVQYARARRTRAAGVDDASALSIVAGQDGVVQIEFPEPLPPGPIHVAAQSADGLQVSREGLDLDFGEHGVLRLAAGARIEGRVIAEPPASGVYVLAYAQSWVEAPGSRRVAVAADGTFSILGVPGRINLVAYAHGRIPSAFWKGDLAPGESAEAELRLGSTAVSRNLRLVIGEGGAPPEGSPLLYASGTSAWSGTTTGASGLVTLPFLSPEADARILVHAIRDDAGLPLSLRFEATVPPAAWSQSDPVELMLPPASRGVLRFADADGNPLPGLHVVLSALSGPSGASAAAATTDTDGRIELGRVSTLLPAGPLRATTPSEQEIWRGDAPGAGQTVDVVVRNLGCVTLRLLDWDGHPVSAPWIAAAILDGSSAVDVDSERDPGFLDLTPPEWLRFEDGATVTLCFDPRKVRDPLATIKVRGVEALLEPVVPGRVADVVLGRRCGIVNCRAFEASGHPVPTVVHLVHVTDRGSQYLAKIHGREGRPLVGLLPGRYRWRARPASAASWEQEGDLDVAAGQTVDLDIVW